MIEDTATWREGLVGQVHFEKDNILLNEAIDCYESKAYRAGYIVAWLCIVESLRNKVKVLSTTGNTQAENSLAAIEKEESALKSNDMKIIEESFACGFINKMEREEIIFLWSQRCKFAHPYLIAPTEMELAYIIEKSISLALCKEIVFKKDYIDELVLNICETAHYIKDDHQYIETHAFERLRRIDGSLHPYFFKSLFFKFSEAYEKESSVQIKRRIRHYLVCILTFNQQTINSDEWRLEDRVIRVPDKFCLLIYYNTWPIFSNRLKDLCIEYIKTPEATELKREGRIHFKMLVFNKVLEEPYLSEFYRLLNNGHLRATGEFYQTSDQSLKERVFSYLSSGDYSDNGHAIDFLYSESGFLFIINLDQDNIEELANLIIWSAGRNCFASQNFIRSFYYNNPRFLAAMFASSLYISDGEVHFYYLYFKHLGNKLNALSSEEEVTRVFQKLQADIDLLNFGAESYNSNLISVRERLQAYVPNAPREYIAKPINNLLSKIEKYIAIVKQNVK